MEAVLTYLSYACLAVGSFLLVSGGVGLLRFPDFYTRMHAASVTDTMAAMLILLGLMLIAGFSLPLMKLMLILALILFASPTAGHALAKSAQHGGLQPKTLAKDERP